MRRVLVSGAVSVFVMTGCGGPAARDDTATDGPRPRADWLVAGGAASCVEQFSVENLAGRSWALDGTITAVVPPKDVDSDDPRDIVTKVTFAVVRWYKGGSGDAVTVLTYNTPGSTTSGDEIDPSIGERILASGEDRYLWGCGFSMPYTEENARIFERAFGR